MKQDRQCTYYVTLRRVHETMVVVEKQYYKFLCVYVRACVRVDIGVGARPLACACARVALLVKH
jgi:hypothetical protein